MKVIDPTEWNRKEHFEYFSGLDHPYWSMVTEMDCSRTYSESKTLNRSFFLGYLHKALLAADMVEEMRLRQVDGQLVCYDHLHASATILREDKTFGCCFIEYRSDFEEFAQSAILQIEKVRARTGMCLEQDCQLDQIHFSTIPWRHFSGLTYAHATKPQDTVPKITFGAISSDSGQVTFPVAIQVHHGLVDGWHLARYLEEFQKNL